MNYPAAIEAEKIVLGTALAYPSRWAKPLASGFKLGDFVGPGHDRIFEAIADLANRDARPTPALVHGAMGKDSPGIDALTAYAKAADAISFETYREAILDQSTRRSLLGAIAEAKDGLASDDPTPGLLATLAERLSQISTGRNERLVHVRDVIPGVLAAIQSRMVDQEASVGVLSGIPHLDYVTGGLKPGQLVIVAGLTGGGKTSLAMQMALGLCMDQGGSCLAANLEMTSAELVERMLAHKGKRDSYHIGRGNLTMETYQDLRDVGDKISRANIYLEDSIYTAADICSRARAWRARHPKERGMVIVDFLQLMRFAQGDRENRARQLGSAAQSLKSLAKELSVPVVLVSQLNRKASDPEAKPSLWHLKESGDIEQAADLILIGYQDGGEPGAEIYPVTIDVAKHRNGKKGAVQAMFQGPFYKFAPIELAVIWDGVNLDV